MIAPDRLTVGITVGTQPPLSRIRFLTRTAKAAGFDAIWTVDHLQGFIPQVIWDRDLSFLADPQGSPHAYYDYQALMGYLAPRAGKAHVGVGVTEAVRRHPVLLAQTAMTVAAMSKRAPLLGIGAGEAENTVPYGLDFARPVSRLEEALEIIRMCFTSQGKIDYAGEFYQLSSAVMDLNPPKGRTPQIWVAAHLPRMLELTGRFGDGWYPTIPYTPDEYAASLQTIRRAAANSGRNPASITPGWQAFVVFGKSEADARRILDSRLMRFTALLAPHYVWSAHGAEHPFGASYGGLVDFVPQAFDRAALDAAIGRVPVDLIAETVLWGTPDTIHAEIRDRVDAGLRHLVIQPVSAMISKSDAAFSVRSMIGLQRRLKREGV